MKFNRTKLMQWSAKAMMGAILTCLSASPVLSGPAKPEPQPTAGLVGKKSSPVAEQKAAAEKAGVKHLRCPDKQPWTDEIVARSINVPVERLKALKAARSLTNEQICTFPEPMLKRAWTKLETGKAGYPDEWVNFRNMQRQSDDGKVKPDGLMKGYEHRKAVLKKIAEKKAAKEARKSDGIHPGVQQPATDLATGTTVDIPISGVDINSAGIASNQWTEIGPGNIGGRIRAILIDPDNTSSIWVGGVAGGIFHSTDYGASFTPVNDFMANLAISSIVMDPANHDIMYAGTGEGFFNTDGVRGYGVFKSTDRGATWSFLSSTTPSTTTSNDAYGWYYVNRLAMSGNGGTILAALRRNGSNVGSIFRSTDGGATWTTPYTSGAVKQVLFDPNDSSKAIAHSLSYNFASSQWESNIIKSIDGGQTWTTPKTFLNTSARIELAYAKSNSQVIYASVDQNSGDIWKSTDGGTTWGAARIANPQHLGNQGWYDNTIWVDPTDANHVVAAGLDVYRSTNGGTTWTKISNWVTNQIDIRYGSGTSHTPHADHHALVSDPGYNGTTNRVLYNGNDGGLYRAPDITLAGESSGWDELNNGLGLTQFYSVAGKSSAGTRIIGGTQDNGMLYNGGPGTDWKMFNGGDGGYSAVDSGNDNYLYGEYVYLQIGRSTDRGATFNYIDKTGSFQLTDSRSDATYNTGSPKSNFIAPFILDPNDSNRMLAGGVSLWLNNAVRTGTSWTVIKASTGVKISAIAVAEGNSAIIWIGDNGGNVYRTINGTDASPTWTLVSSSTSGTAQGRMVTRILIDKDDAAKVYVSYGGYNNTNLWRTTDNGSTWSDLNSPARVLPAVPYFTVTRHPLNPDWIYVGTEVGLFTSQDGGTTWSASNDGPANVEIADIAWRDNMTLIAATHGRGMFLATAIVKTDTTTTVASNINPSAGGQTVTFTATVSSASATGTVTFYDGATTLGSAALSSGTATFTTAALSVGSHSITASYGGDGSYNGSTSTVLAQTVNPPLTGISTSLLPHGGTGTPYSQSLSATGGTPPFTWEIVSAALPTGMTINSASGLISGTPTVSGVYSFVAKVTDSLSAFVTKNLSITVNDAFCANDPLRIDGAPSVFYPDFLTVYPLVADNDVVQFQALNFTSDFLLDKDLRIALRGGYDCGYTAVSGMTGLTGTLRIRNGTVDVGGIRLR